MGHYLYKYEDQQNNLLYVGETKDPKGRYLSHRCNSEFFKKHEKCFISKVETKALALYLESILIRKLKPKFNKAVSDNANYDILELKGDIKWSVFSYKEQSKLKKVYSDSDNAKQKRKKEKELKRDLEAFNNRIYTYKENNKSFDLLEKLKPYITNIDRNEFNHIEVFYSDNPICNADLICLDIIRMSYTSKSGGTSAHLLAGLSREINNKSFSITFRDENFTYLNSGDVDNYNSIEYMIYRFYKAIGIKLNTILNV